MNVSLQGKKAFVCGSSKGIGLGIAKALAGAGATVILSGRVPETLTEAMSTLPGTGHSFFPMNQSDPQAINEAAEFLNKASIDILINNTGGPDPGLITNASWPKFEAALTQQLQCSHALTLACLDHMKQLQYGRIINVISTSVKIPIYGLGVSNTVRGAVASWAKTLSLEVAQAGITVNNLLPGFIETDRLDQVAGSMSKSKGVSKQAMIEELQSSVPAKRFGTVEEFAALAVFLASEFASYINGTSIPVDGGRTGSI